MSECDFLYELKHDFSEQNYMVVRIPDDAKAQRDELSGDNFKAGDKPFDIMFGRFGKIFCIETKQVKKGMAFPFSMIRKCQWDGMEAAEKAGWLAGVAVNFRIRLDTKQRAIVGTEDWVLNKSFYFPHWWLKWARTERAVNSLNLAKLYYVKENAFMAPFEVRPRNRPGTHADGRFWDTADVTGIARHCTPLLCRSDVNEYPI